MTSGRNRDRARTTLFFGALVVLGALVAWAVGTWPEDRWPRRPPDPAVLVRGVAVTVDGRWVTPVSAAEAGAPPTRDACLPGVRTWLRRLGAEPTGLNIRFFLVSERTQTVSITGIRARPQGRPSPAPKTQIIAECERDYVEPGEHVVWADPFELGRGGAARSEHLDWGGEGERKPLDLDLGRGDSIEFILPMTAKAPGPVQRWSLELEFTVDGRKWYLPIMGPPGSFVLAPPLPAGSSTIRVTKSSQGY